MLTGCGNPVKSFEDTIDSKSESEFTVDCSNEVNRNKKGNIDDIGYLCQIGITDTTTFTDNKGNPLQWEDFSQGDLIRIILAKPQNINEDNLRFDAREIILVSAE